jgi:hypothetical protein
MGYHNRQRKILDKRGEVKSHPLAEMVNLWVTSDEVKTKRSRGFKERIPKNGK